MIEVEVVREQLKEERWPIIERALQRLQQANGNLMDMQNLIVREDNEKGTVVFAYEEKK